MKIKNQILSFIAIVAVALTTFSCTGDSPKEVTPLKSILDIAKADPTNFSILVDALKKTSLDATLGGAGSYTVFAPTNAAFATAGITSASISAMTSATDIAALKLTLQNHVLGLGTRSNDLLATGYTKTFGALKVPASASSTVNLSVFVNKVGSDVLVNGGTSNGGAKVTIADIQANNGIIHVIDAVLKLPTIVSQIKANPSLSSLLSVVASTPQASVLAALNAATNVAPLTVYAPNNDAFTTATATGGYLVGKNDSQITNILKYHVESGNRAPSSTSSYSSTDLSISTLYTPIKFTILAGTVKIKDVVGASNGTVKTFNIQGTTGVIQVVDKVLQPFL
jgi:uncharacterized surface protein with fasciclin (FAS1) repeats